MPDPIILPVAEYAPDMPALSKTSANITNVYPRTPLSYGAVRALSPVYGSLTARCQGAAAFRDSSGNVFVFAGDINDLYNLKAGSADWAKVSAVSGGYSCPSDDEWHFTYFNGDVLATNLTDGPQVFNLASSSAFKALPGSPPAARYIAVVKNAFVVLGNTYDGVNGNKPQRVWWSAAGQDNSWPALGSATAAQLQSSATDLLGPLGWVQGIAADLINADAVIFQEYGLKTMTYAGPPDIFTFLPVQNARGTSAPNSIVVDGGVAYYLGQDGFYAFDGAATKPIGLNRVDKTLLGDPGVAGDLDLTNINRVVGAADPVNRLIWWAYPGKDNFEGNPNRLLCYNREIDRWSLCNLGTETLVRTLSIGYTLDQLYTILGYTLDNLPAPLDSSVWTGGRLQMGIFDTTHTLNFMTGTQLQAVVETEEMEVVPGRRVFISNSRPLIDGAVPTVAIGHRERQQDSVTYTSESVLNSLGFCPTRTSGRYVRGRITVPTPVDGAWTNISGLALSGVPMGNR